MPDRLPMMFRSLTPRLAHCLLMVVAVFASGCDEPAVEAADDGCDGAFVFVDEATGFSTCNIVDLDGQGMRFFRETSEMLWVESDEKFDRFPIAQGYIIGELGLYQVRFGRFEGKQWAWLTGAQDGLICDVERTSTLVAFQPTEVSVPQE
ncbi:MAG: hypothetical protein ACI9OJ_001306 [Myxococcota bacterium]|jgi:hypothetical protein